MNLSHLYYFCKLAELQHYTQAAQELYITQPSLSGAIACIEDELGIKLFQKRGRNVYLTKYGKEFYDYVSVALRELDKGIAVAKENAGLMGGSIDIGCISTIQGDYLPTVIRDFKTQKGPNIKFNIYQVQTNAIVKAIKADLYDIGFCTPLNNEHDLYFVPLLSQPLIAVVNDKHPLAVEQTLTFEKLRDYQIISYQTEQPVGRNIQTLLKSHGLTADHSYSDEVTLCGLVRIEPSVAILLQTPSLQQFHDLHVINLPEVPHDFHIVHMVFKQNRYHIRAVESFIDFVAAFHSYVPPENAN